MPRGLQCDKCAEKNRVCQVRSDAASPRCISCYDNHLGCSFLKKPAKPSSSKKTTASAADVLSDPSSSPTSGKALLKQITKPFRRSTAKADEAPPPSANTRGQLRVEVSLPTRNQSLISSSQTEVVPPPEPSAVRGPPRRSNHPDYEVVTIPSSSSRRGPPSVASRTSPFEFSSAPSLPPPSPYLGGSGPSQTSLASASSSFVSLTPDSPMYALELQRLQFEFRRSQENLETERQTVAAQQALYRQTQEVFARTERQHQEAPRPYRTSASR